MNAILDVTPGRLKAFQASPPCVPPEPVQALLSALRCIEREVTPFPLQPGAEAAAVSFLDAAGPMLEPGYPEDLLIWLCHLRHSVRGAPVGSDEAKGLQAIIRSAAPMWEDCHALPRVVWSEATRSVWRRQPARGSYLPGAHWPVAGELYAVLAPVAWELQTRVRRCRKLLTLLDLRRAGDRAAQVGPPTAEAIAAVSRTLQQLHLPVERDDSQPRGVFRTRPPVRPVAPTQLDADEAAAEDAAAFARQRAYLSQMEIAGGRTAS